VFLWKTSENSQKNVKLNVFNNFLIKNVSKLTEYKKYFYNYDKTVKLCKTYIDISYNAMIRCR